MPISRGEYAVVFEGEIRFGLCLMQLRSYSQYWGAG
jgi:hypothetical protein